MGIQLGQDEKAILIAVKKGNKEIYGQIVKKYMKKAYYIAYGFVHSEDDALDISQEAFIKSYKNIKKFDTQKSFFPWFYTILRNLCLDLIKKHKKKAIITDTLKKTREAYSFDDNCSQALIWELLDKLEPKHREVIVLKNLYGYSYQEIADIIQKPVGTVMSSLFYARKNLQKLMGELK